MAPGLLSKAKPSFTRQDAVGKLELTQTFRNVKTKTLRLARPLPGWLQTFCTAGLLVLAVNRAQASIAYGTINNFDTVNDTSNVCHGFEIELDDCRSADITYCYSYNHYGTPNIREDTFSAPGHTNCFVRYAAVYSNGVWSAYTAIPTGPIPPTAGHSFINPGTNFGGEHFGVGYYGSPTAIKYNWLLDDGTGQLVHGPAVLVSTPVFAYYPPVVGVAAQVQAEVQPPAPEVQPIEGFGPASWVKSIKTVAHTNRVVELRNLVSDDPAFPDDKSWRNGETSEVESEFDLLQQEFGSSGGHHGGGGGGGGSLSVTNAPEDLAVGDEIITRRYEFYAYSGPTDPVSHEALAKKVGPDGIHGINQYSNTVVVGDFLGAQMSAYKHELPIGLTENIADGKVNTLYPTRTIVISGVPFLCTNTGVLPAGMTFNLTTGELSGTPTESGIFTFKVRASSTNHDVSMFPDAPATALFGSDGSASPLATPARLAVMMAASQEAAAVGVVQGYTGSQIFNTTFATADPTEPIHCNTLGGASYWLAYQPPANGTVTLDTIGSSYDTVMEVYSYNAPPTSYQQLISVACDHDSVPGAARVQFAVVKTRQYVVAVAGVNGARGTAYLNYTLNTNQLPQPPTLTSAPVTVVVTNGADVLLTAPVSGSLPLHFSWSKDTVPITNSFFPALALFKVSPASTGLYSVTVTNDLGGTNTTLPLHVVVPPKSGLARTSSSALTLNFPTQDGLSYLIEAAADLRGPWQEWTNQFIGSGEPLTIPMPLSSNALFFRVRVQ